MLLEITNYYISKKMHQLDHFLISHNKRDLFIHKKYWLIPSTLPRLVASANSPTIVKLIRELFIGELLNRNYLEFQKARFKIIHYENTLNNVFN